MSERRVRFTPARAGLSPNAPWGVHDYLAKCWAVAPELSEADAKAKAAEMENASKGRGR